MLFAVGLFTGRGANAADTVPKTDTVPKADAEVIDLPVGALAPVFESVDDRGQRWASADYVGNKYLVIYFYPADFTTGCIKQAETFRDTMNQLNAQGVEVIGVSGDSVKNHELFKQSWMLNYTLLADEEGDIAAKFGVAVKPGGNVVPSGPDRKRILDENGESFRLERKATFARWTFIIGKDGKVLYKNTEVQPAKDSQQVLEIICDLEKKGVGTTH
jgi:peroxiredoxin Q/BCP